MATIDQRRNELLSDIVSVLSGGGTVGGTIVGNSVTTTINYTAITTDFSIRVDASSGPITITIPSASTLPRKMLGIKKIDSSANAVTVAGDIDGGTSYPLLVQNQSIFILSNNATWDSYG